MSNLSVAFDITGTKQFQSLLGVLIEMLEDETVPQVYKDKIKCLVDNM